jgi:alpha-1,2-mannosyltransferase
MAVGVYAINLALHPHVLTDVDLAVYRDAGLVARRSPAQLYQWQQSTGLSFTYTPFAAAFCAALSLLPWRLAAWLMLAGSVAALLQAVRLTFGGLGWYGASQLGMTCAVAAAAFWLEPVQRTLNMGEVDLLLMLLVVWDLSNDGRRWQGAALGAAAGMKLLALIFIPYLLLTGRRRSAAKAAGTFAASVVAGALLYPRASVTWWLDGAFWNARRTGFVGYLANQSLLGMTTRIAGSVPSTAVWLLLAVLVGVPGLLLVALLHRRGQPVQGMVVCAITGLIVSPVSWDHHWVWIALALAVLASMAVRSQGSLRVVCGGYAALHVVVFGAWPSLWTGGGSVVPWGLIWYAPYTPGDAGSTHPEYQWAGLRLLAGNLYLLTGSAMLVAVAVAAIIRRRAAQ